MASTDALDGATLALDRPVVDSSGRFDNPWPTWKEKTFLEAMKWMLFDNKGGVSLTLEGNKNPKPADFAAAFPCHSPDFSAQRSAPEDSVQAMWVGHASLLVQLGGVTFFTDPVFSERCSPLSFAGPKRVVRTPFKLDDPALPHVDFVLISHNHYDHLCLASVRQLHKRFGDTLVWYVPLKLGKWFRGCGIPASAIVELDWWQEVQHRDSKVTVALTPAQHWSNRGTDRRMSLWGGYAVFTKQARFYFAGDTGYCPVFSQIGKQYGPFDLAAIPVGAYEPRSFMEAQHVNPEEAVRIHKEVGAKKSVGIHCCTFCLTNEPLDEPPRLLKEAAKRQGLAADEFVVLQHGTTISTSDGATSGKLMLL